MAQTVIILSRGQTQVVGKTEPVETFSVGLLSNEPFENEGQSPISTFMTSRAENGEHLAGEGPQCIVFHLSKHDGRRSSYTLDVHTHSRLHSKTLHSLKPLVLMIMASLQVTTRRL